MKDNLKKMMAYYKPYKRLFWTDMFFAVLESVIALSLPLVIRYLTSEVIYRPSNEALKETAILAAVMAAMLFVGYFSRRYISYQGHVMGTYMEADMREDLFGHLQKLSFSFYDDQKVGQLMSRITSDLFDICELMHHGPENLVISLFKIIGALIILLSISPILALSAFALLPFMGCFAYFYNKKMRAAFYQNRVKTAAINEQIEDNLSGIRVVKSFANEAIEEEKFRTGNKAYIASKTNAYKYMGGFNAGLNAFTTAIQIVVIITGAILITGARIQVTDLLTFLLYIHIFTEPVRVLLDFTEQFQNGYTGFQRFQEILHIEPDIRDEEGAVVAPAFRGDIEFHEVSFHYAGNADVLHRINMKVPAGSYMALCGSSGAGKTTLCSLIPRFYEVSEGRITIDGTDIRKFTLKSLRDQIGIVQQDVYLFAGTVYENIAYGKPGASREEVIKAAKEANAHEFILSLPDGYDTDIGQRGIKLSGGQKQRLSIARVFLKNPPILIFDEATSALDNESEHVVQESLERLSKNRTTFVIAHRLTTIRNAQKILVLTEEGIAEEGAHEELLALGGIYEKLYHLHEEKSTKLV